MVNREGEETAGMPRVVGDSRASADGDVDRGAVWRLSEPERDLDSNVILLPPGERIEAHVGPDLDVLVHVLDGSGELLSGDESVPLSPGALVWLPRRSERAFVAGDQGLRYLTVHRRRQSLVIDTSRLRSSGDATDA